VYSHPSLTCLYGTKIGSKAVYEDAQIVARALRDCIPQNIPLPFSSILKTTSSKGKKKSIKAVLEMFDGKHDTIKVSTWGYLNSWSLQWILTKDSGSSFNWDGNKWIRIDESFWRDEDIDL